MTPAQFLPIVVHAAPLLPKYDTPEARCFLLAVAGQEAGWSKRLQVPVAHARGFWRCEKNGQLLGVLTHKATGETLNGVLAALCIPLGLDSAFEAIAWCDDLAYCVARLALVLDPLPLPAIGAGGGVAWETYVRVWKPGRPRPETWAGCWDAAVDLFAPATAVAGEPSLIAGGPSFGGR